MSLQLLWEEYRNCQKCPVLVQNRSQVVFGVGDEDRCKVVIIGEAPGKQEDLNGEPFVGRSGQILNTLLEEIGLTRSDVYITNTVLCRPPDNRNPTAEELSNCKSRLEQHLKILAPAIVITLGNFASRYLLDTKQGITTLRGTVVNKNGMTIIPMYHPAVILYSGNSPDTWAIMRKDFAAVQEILGNRDK